MMQQRLLTLLLILSSACASSHDAAPEETDAASAKAADDDAGVTFRCSHEHTDTCPTGDEYPTVPLGQNGCETVPGLFDHPEIPLSVGRAAGCIVTLPYENPYYRGSPQTCTCTPSAARDYAEWSCGL